MAEKVDIEHDTSQSATDTDDQVISHSTEREINMSKQTKNDSVDATPPSPAPAMSRTSSSLSKEAPRTATKADQPAPSSAVNISSASSSSSSTTTTSSSRSKEHIRLLQQYNEIRDVGLGLMGIIAETRGVRLREICVEFGVGVE